MQDSLCSTPNQAEQQHLCTAKEAGILANRAKNTALGTGRGGESCSAGHGQQEGMAHR